MSRTSHLSLQNARACGLRRCAGASLPGESSAQLKHQLDWHDNVQTRQTTCFAFMFLDTTGHGFLGCLPKRQFSGKASAGSLEAPSHW